MINIVNSQLLFMGLLISAVSVPAVAKDFRGEFRDNFNNKQATIWNGFQTGKQVVTDVRISKRLRAKPRKYTIYVPHSYTGREAYPVVFSYHGFKSDMEKNYTGSKLYKLAEKEKFIVVHPQGLANKMGVRKWNAIGSRFNQDVAFTKYLIQTLNQNYNIDNSRIYATGMSNGGYFSLLLACTMSDTFAGVASVTGAMFKPVLQSCQPNHPVPMIQIHGTDDPVVKYDTAIQAVDFWVNQNKARKIPVVTDVPDIHPNDGSTVQRYVYKNPRNGAEVQHLKIIGGGHSWAGAESGKAGTNQDIIASAEVWSFLKRFELTTK